MTDVLYGIFVGPFKDIVTSPTFFVEVIVGGILAGLLY